MLDDYEVWRSEIEIACALGPQHSDEARLWKAVLADEDLAATIFRQENTMAVTRKRKRKGVKTSAGFMLPTERRVPVDDPWRYAYLITGEKKIGKTTFAVEGCEEFMIQFDKAQIAYPVRETCPKTWHDFEQVLKALETAAASGDFPYTRVIVDGVGEWYQVCLESVLGPGMKDPGDADDFGKTWRALATKFTKAVNRLLALQIDADCGLMFIAHSEWKEVKTRSGKIQCLKPNLTARCDEILNGKVDAWFQYDYVDEARVLVIQGSQTIAAGHRIDGHFRTPDGERVREIPMGNSPKEALKAFLKAFANKQEHPSYDGYIRDRRKDRTASRRSGNKRKAVRRKR